MRSKAANVTFEDAADGFCLGLGNRQFAESVRRALGYSVAAAAN
jgi:hypothetical protein